METDADGMEVLGRAVAIALPETQEVGRLVYTRRALPTIVPVNYAVRGGAILVWTGSSSSLVQAVRGSIVSFEVDDLDRAAHAGWSVTVTATAGLVTDEVELAKARVDGPVPWAPGIKEYLIWIPLTVVTGRRLGSRAPDANEPRSAQAD